MHGTNFPVGFGIGGFFLVGGIVMFLLGDQLFPSGTAAQEIGGAGDTFRMIGLVWAGVAALLLALFWAIRRRGARRAAIAATGYPGTATVVSAEQTGLYVNQNPQFRLTLDLGGRQVERKAVVPMPALGRFGLGTRMPVRISQADPDDFEIMWDELPAPGTLRAN